MQRRDPAFRNISAQLFVAECAAFSGWASAHSPSIIVDMIFCPKSFAIRSTAGFSSLKKDLGSSESWYSPSNDIRGFWKRILCVLRSRTTRSEEHTSELQSLAYLVCRLLL